MTKILFLLLTTATFAATGVAQKPATPKPKIDVSALPAQATMIDDVVVPVPSEIFGVLDKLGKPPWSKVLRAEKNGNSPIGTDSPRIALQLGTVIAEGFIAVEAENPVEVKNIGGNVRRLAKALGVEKQVQERAQAIIDGADAKNWPAVRLELDGALQDVRQAMMELGSEALSQLVSLGGWLRGTEALTEVVASSYSKDGAELLHQPVLLDYFDRRISTMKPKEKSNPLVGEVHAGLLEIRPLIGLNDGSQISEKTVKEIGDVASRLVKSINSNAK